MYSIGFIAAFEGKVLTTPGQGIIFYNDSLFFYHFFIILLLLKLFSKFSMSKTNLVDNEELKLVKLHN